MMKKFGLFLLATACSFFSYAQNDAAAHKWVEETYKKLTNEERIAQLIIIRAYSNKGVEPNVVNSIKKYNVGSICFFQGGPVRQAKLTNYYQSIAKTPILITIDGEYGLGMRLDSVTQYPYAMTLGAVADPSLVYRTGKAIGAQHKRLGVHVDYAPVVDINNNPNNPVIGFRSFGEDKYRVAKMGVAYMKGMQDAGIMACAKHFPGHGDVDVDSHLDLPVINKSRAELDDMELYPFREMIKAGVQSVMVGHLSVPSIEKGKNRATSISANAVNGILRNELGFTGLTFTDALEMKGVAKFFPGGTIAVEALIAGNDMLCLPESVEGTINAVKEAIKQKRLSWKDIEAKVKKVLRAKYNLGLAHQQPVVLDNLLADLNAETNAIRQEVAKNALTLLKLTNTTTFRNEFFSWPLKKDRKIAYVGFGTKENKALGERLKKDFNADVFYIKYNEPASKGGMVVKAIEEGKYDDVIIGFHDLTLRNTKNNNYGITQEALKSWYALNKTNAITLVFGNPLAINSLCGAQSLVVCYEDDDIFQNVAADWLRGDFVAQGSLPMSVCAYKAGDGKIITNPETAILEPIGDERFAEVDSLAQAGINRRAFPGCVILAAKDGKIVYHKAFGNYEFENAPAMQLHSIFDLASVTKISAVTVSIMKLVEEGKVDLKKKLKDYLPFTRKTNKADLTLENILLHQAGMVPFIPFYKATLDEDGNPRTDLYRSAPEPGFTTPVARNLYIRDDWKDTIWASILQSPVVPQGRKYEYSDNDFWFLGKIVETVSGKALEEYVRDNFYIPLHMTTTGYRPLERFPLERIVPTEIEYGFRNQLIHGTVHDEGAALGGGVAGHAGLFSSAYDLGKLYQMLLNGGELNGRRFLKWETIQNFTAYRSSISRRGYGFDKPEKDNDTRQRPYPSQLASPQTYGHTGFTGTCVWVDPKYNILYVFLSNRVYPSRNSQGLVIDGKDIRGQIQDAIYRALGVTGIS
ncbi:glycoside hydrolase family 3 N-terminal domain-containing protein [Niabella digestorum]|jgi:Beta-glucosidase-related glycosidases|uniref:beta-N-acetylhexosaminidase n=1 Tax=Niabella digestorum TaxID=3117701 RepID=A0ABU7RH22_9BACT